MAPELQINVVSFGGRGKYRVQMQATQDGAESLLPPKAWQTWALLRTGK